MTQKLNIQIGEKQYNYQGQIMEIIHVNNYADITIQFEDGTIREHMSYGCFKKGSIKNYMIPTVYGVGIIGNEKTRIGNVRPKDYVTWKHMLQRCYKKDDRFYKYIDCNVSKEWLYFPNFRQWCLCQENWNAVLNNPKIFQLDKDILNKGNKTYSPDCCTFVPQWVNNLFTKNNSKRGNLPIGVCKHKNNQYRALHSKSLLVTLPQSHICNTAEEAFFIYKYEKEQTIKIIAEKEYNIGNITKRCYEAMINYCVEITD